MRQEIGSEFWTGCQPGGSGRRILPELDGLHLVLSGRTALDCVLSDILRSERVKKALLPSYCCQTMIEPFFAHGISVEFFEVFADAGGIGVDLPAETDCSVVLLMEYFGFGSPALRSFAEKLRACGKTVIFDATHSLLMEEYRAFSFPADYICGSVRKWTDINLGFCLKTQGSMTVPPLEDCPGYTELRNRAFDLKRAYICEESDEKQTFLQMFSDAETYLERHYRGKAADARSIAQLSYLDADLLRCRRRENALLLTQSINDLGSEQVRCLYPIVQQDDCPLVVPLTTAPELRDALHCRLVQRGFYFPRHWPRTDDHTFRGSRTPLFDIEISAVCDQRYTPEDMRRIAAEIGRFLIHV
ncbi:MAG: hypothetical protein IJJ99_05945 [Oscillospiraceae bacterium]|nr:hypothetical protein [Oscillospiraceae bacterium]